MRRYLETENGAMEVQLLIKEMAKADQRKYMAPILEKIDAPEAAVIELDIETNRRQLISLLRLRNASQLLSQAGQA
jgi:hypothetical protein